MIKITFFIPSLGAGGAEKQTVNIANYLADNGFQVNIVLCQSAGIFLQKVSNKVRITSLNVKYTSISIFKLISYLKLDKPDLLISAIDNANIVAIIARFFLKYPFKLFISVRSTVSKNLGKSTNIKNKILLYFVKRFYRYADVIIAVSNGISDDLIKTCNISAHKIQVIYNPVINPSIFNLAKEPIQHNWFHKDSVEPVVLAMGRLESNKGFHILIQAFAKIRDKAKLVIVGGAQGNYYHTLTNLIQKLNINDKVILLPFQENPYPYLKQSKVFVLSSFYEGLPGVLIEALALTPCLVATDCPSGPREILDHGRYGALVPVGDVEALALAISSALKKCPESDTNRNVFLKQFTEEVVMQKYLKLFLKS